MVTIKVSQHTRVSIEAVVDQADCPYVFADRYVTLGGNAEKSDQRRRVHLPITLTINYSVIKGMITTNCRTTLVDRFEIWCLPNKIHKSFEGLLGVLNTVAKEFEAGEVSSTQGRVRLDTFKSTQANFLLPTNACEF